MWKETYIKEFILVHLSTFDAEPAYLKRHNFDWFDVTVCALRVQSWHMPGLTNDIVKAWIYYIGKEKPQIQGQTKQRLKEMAKKRKNDPQQSS